MGIFPIYIPNGNLKKFPVTIYQRVNLKYYNMTQRLGSFQDSCPVLNGSFSRNIQCNFSKRKQK